MQALVDFLVRRSRLLTLLSLLSVAVALWYVPRAQIDNSIEVWVGRRSDAFREYQEFRGRYGSDELVIVAAEMAEPLSENAVAAQRELTEAMRQIEGVDSVSSLPEAHAALMLLSPETAGRPQEHPLIRNLLLSADGKTVGVVAWLKPLGGPTARRQVVDRVTAASEAFRRHGYEPHIVGTPVLNVALDRASSREAKLLLPVAGALSMVVLVLLLRSASAAAACLAAAIASVLWTLAAMAMTGVTLNLISVAMPSLLLVLSFAPAIHIASRFLADPHVGERPMDVMRETLGEMLIPVVLTTVTTVFGFASLMVTDMQPVFEVGLFASIGILISLVLTFTLTPGLLLLLPARKAKLPVPGPSHWTARIGAATVRNRRAVAIVSLAITVLSASLLFRIRTESNVLSFLPPQSTVARDYRFVSERLTGLYTLELDVAVAVADEPAAMSAIAAICGRLAERPDVARADHYGNFAPLLERIRALGKLVPIAGGASNPVAKAAAHFRSVDNGTVHLRASLLVRSMASEDFYDLVTALRKEASGTLPAGSRWDVTGAVLLLNNAQAALVQTQVRSFALAGGLVLAIIGLLFKSWRVMAAATVPNFLAVMGTFAMMALAGIPIDPATVMIASVAIGLTVDNTIHYVASYRMGRPRVDRVAAAAWAMEKSGRPIVFTSLVAAAGFAMLCLAEFRPLADFGLLTGATLLTAMVADLTATPAWMAVLRVWENDDARKDAGTAVGANRPSGVDPF